MSEFVAVMIVLFLSGSAFLASLLCLRRPDRPSRSYDIDEIVKNAPLHRLAEFKVRLPRDEHLPRIEAIGIADRVLLVLQARLSEADLANLLEKGPQLLWHEGSARSLTRLVTPEEAIPLKAEGWRDVVTIESGMAEPPKS
ncbi:hypothetical protein [Tropicimonas sp. IMCC34011]|uniref:hypothetical protein n=1 Tax=Tropicimonas sp. IMCC34011 TaxID=2248759 RepID=UPI000E235EEC|nr:hypothetical protein [Tropicimonas sp. IMCC34011]